MNKSLVSVIIPTQNSSETLERCLDSIKKQTYKNLEIFVVDNNSIDQTKQIAKKYTNKVFNKGPERSIQRNFGVKKSRGKYVFIIDSDMELSETVAEDCVKNVQSNSHIVAVIIPEESFGVGFWAECKKLERSFYVGVQWMEAARFFRKDIYQKTGGYDETMVSGEDWDLSQKIEREGEIGRIDNYIYHNEGKINIFKSIKKKFGYAKEFSNYVSKNKNCGQFRKQTGMCIRYKLFFSQPEKLFKNPVIGLGMLFMKTCEFGFGGVKIMLNKL
jgi:glycosyltransferase involved in cell wall biosynthesis